MAQWRFLRKLHGDMIAGGQALLSQPDRDLPGMSAAGRRPLGIDGGLGIEGFLPAPAPGVPVPLFGIDPRGSFQNAALYWKSGVFIFGFNDTGGNPWYFLNIFPKWCASS